MTMAWPPSVSSGDHICTEHCQCPLHEIPLLYSSTAQTHACQNRDCHFANGMNKPSPSLIWLRQNIKQTLTDRAEEIFRGIRYRSTLEVTMPTALAQTIREICPDRLCQVYPPGGGEQAMRGGSEGDD
jgi:hypothetical protein